MSRKVFFRVQLPTAGCLSVALVGVAGCYHQRTKREIRCEQVSDKETWNKFSRANLCLRLISCSLATKGGADHHQRSSSEMSTGGFGGRVTCHRVGNNNIRRSKFLTIAHRSSTSRRDAGDGGAVGASSPHGEASTRLQPRKPGGAMSAGGRSTTAGKWARYMRSCLPFYPIPIPYLLPLSLPSPTSSLTKIRPEGCVRVSAR
jgi:hypothetical protein